MQSFRLIIFNFKYDMVRHVALAGVHFDTMPTSTWNHFNYYFFIM